jgi:hypothetical protein
MLHFICEVNEKMNIENNAQSIKNHENKDKEIDKYKNAIDQKYPFYSKKDKTESTISIVLISLIIFILIFLIGYLIYIVIQDSKKKNKEKEDNEIRQFPIYISNQQREFLSKSGLPENLNELLFMIENGDAQKAIKNIISFLEKNCQTQEVKTFASKHTNITTSFDYGKLKVENFQFTNDNEKQNLMKIIKDILENSKKNPNNNDYYKIKINFYLSIVLKLIEGEFDFYEKNNNYELRMVASPFEDQYYKRFYELYKTKDYFLLF